MNLPSRFRNSQDKGSRNLVLILYPRSTTVTVMSTFNQTVSSLNRSHAIPAVWCKLITAPPPDVQRGPSEGWAQGTVARAWAGMPGVSNPCAWNSFQNDNKLKIGWYYRMTIQVVTNLLFTSRKSSILVLGSCTKTQLLFWWQWEVCHNLNGHPV